MQARFRVQKSEATSIGNDARLALQQKVGGNEDAVLALA
jgi:hypothetical protein